MLSPTERFSSRVSNYVKYRPTYPHAVIELLATEVGLGLGSTVADVGSGTGIFSAQLLGSGAHVIGIEPNDPMRLAAEQLLGDNDHFVSVEGSAEATTLEDGSVDVVTAAQAFHWFDVARAKLEFDRILKPGGAVALIWNDRSATGTEFLDGYEKLLLEHSPEYAHVNHRNVTAGDLRGFFSPRDMRVAEFENRQLFDFEGLRGRLLSSSYAPEVGSPGFAPMIEGLERLFDRTSQDGQVAFLYQTQVFFG